DHLYMHVPNDQNAKFGIQNADRAFQLKKEPAQLGFDKAKEAKDVLRDGALRLEEQAKEKDGKGEAKAQLRQLNEDKPALLQDREQQFRVPVQEEARRAAGLEVDRKKRLGGGFGAGGPGGAMAGMRAAGRRAVPAMQPLVVREYAHLHKSGNGNVRT